MNADAEFDTMDLHGLRIPRSWMDHHLGVFGTTGSGKTHAIIKPLLRQALAGGDAAIIVDVKGDLQPVVLEALERCGRIDDLVTLGIGPKDHTYNPLDKRLPSHKLTNLIVSASSVASLTSSSKVGGDDLFWSTARNELLAAMIEWAIHDAGGPDAEQPLTFRQLQRLRPLLAQPQPLLRVWASSSADMLSESAGLSLVEFAQYPDTTRACVLTSATNLIAPFLRPPLSQFVLPSQDRPTLRLHDIINRSRVVLVTTSQSEYANELLPAFLMLKTAIYQMILSRSRLAVRQDNRILVILDEFNRLLVPDDFCGNEHVVMEAARANKAGFVLAAQSLSGLEAVAGKTIVDKLAALTGNLVFLANSCPVTALLAERCCGYRTVHKRHRSVHKCLPPPLLIPEQLRIPDSQEGSTVLVPTQEPVLPASKLARLKPGEGYVKLIDGSVRRLTCSFD